jgi:hypothetical protein
MAFHSLPEGTYFMFIYAYCYILYNIPCNTVYIYIWFWISSYLFSHPNNYINKLSGGLKPATAARCFLWVRLWKTVAVENVCWSSWSSWVWRSQGVSHCFPFFPMGTRQFTWGIERTRTCFLSFFYLVSIFFYFLYLMCGAASSKSHWFTTDRGEGERPIPQSWFAWSLEPVWWNLIDIALHKNQLFVSKSGPATSMMQ